ncbi:MAG: DUF4332 domain-containing protein [Cyanobacteria bacterium SW_9_44_58]|nr:MAG: DUF4332 domain-containing protein [Cyanobacteria bacterium SW_9_44_58]
MDGKNWPIQNLPRLDETVASRLQELGITTTQELLKKAQSNREKEKIAHYLEQKPQQVSKWVIMADLARVPSVGCQYCGLLLHAGIGSIKQLSQMHPQKLHRQVLHLQVSLFKRRDYCPSVGSIQQWIQQAKQLTTHH